MTNRSAPSSSDVERYVREYLTLDVQDPSTAPTDPQLATLVPWIVDRLTRSASGAILDIGCGDGVLFARLAELPAFMSNPGWVYVGIGEEVALAKVHSLARSLRISRRTELIERSSFYESWPALEPHQIIFVRNVLHEIDVDRTAQLLHHIYSNFGTNDELVIQDLMKLPFGERHSACWIPQELEACLRAHGFGAVQLTVQPSRSGNAWFNIIASQKKSDHVTQAESKSRVQSARQRQWMMWTQVEQEFSQNLPGRSELVEALDIDLQLSALTRQLRNAGGILVSLDESVERRVRSAEFTKRLASAIEAGTLITVPIEEQIHFRERGEQLTVLETFLRTADRLAVVRGGGGTGKTSLVRRVLSTRAYDKFVVIIDCRRSKDIWSFLEVIFSQFGLKLDTEILSVLTNLEFSSIQQSLRQFFNKYSRRTIFFLDNFSDIVDSNGDIADQELAELLDLMASREGTKIIITSRNEYLPASLQNVIGKLPVSVRVGRYGTDQTVINILDDHFSRAAAGIDSYPDELLSAIDRHPLITSLAAKILRKRGRDILLDRKFISELKNQIRDDLWNRLVDDISRPAVETASQLRVPIPRDMLRQLADETSIAAARDADVLHATTDNRWQELLSTLALFRVRDVSDTPDTYALDGERSKRPLNHQEVANLYRSVYRVDDDPKWIRESYYHLLLAGDGRVEVLSTTAGKYYYTELVASADYAFVRRRDYKLALELFRAANSIKPLQELPERRRASCLIRRKLRAEGEKAYAALRLRYPASRGIKTSHVDALLYLSDFDAALAALQTYLLKPEDSEWVTYQWGRAHLGLDQYAAAIQMFQTLVARGNGDPHFYVHLARALEQFGQSRSAIGVLQQGRGKFPDSVGIATALGVAFERAGDEVGALALLEPLFAARSDNVQAAASIIRIYVDRGRLNDASRIFHLAERSAPSNLGPYIKSARADLLIGAGQPVRAVEYLLQENTVDSYLLSVMLRAIYRSFKGNLDEGTKHSLALRGLAVSVPTRFNQNAPIQILKAELAMFVNDQISFAAAASLLEGTGIDKKISEELRTRWNSRKGSLEAT